LLFVSASPLTETPGEHDGAYDEEGAEGGANGDAGYGA
jgi:hypothetical protein